MTTKEAAEYLRLHENTVLNMAHTGEIPCRKVGRLWRFRRSVLDGWLRGEVDSSPALRSASEVE
jgi:excisionase family DNA binding protein